MKTTTTRRNISSISALRVCDSHQTDAINTGFIGEVRIRVRFNRMVVGDTVVSAESINLRNTGSRCVHHRK